jgi:4,5-DOPA dioxygenase extradiol
MNRKQFLHSTVILGMGGMIYKTDILNQIKDWQHTERMPVLFVGHGSPMNAIEDNEFTKGWRALGKSLPKPTAILCVSAHWETNGTWVTAMEKPRTIHDFGGFPKELYEIQYPAAGSPALATTIKNEIKTTVVGLDTKWGLDHGAWSVIRHLYPDFDIPVLQLSLDQAKNPADHYQLAKELSSLRNKGVLIIASGNMVHHLGMINWTQPDSAYDWATEANQKIKDWIMNGDHQSLINYKNQGRSLQLAAPSPEHFLPLLYTLGLHQKDEQISFFNDRCIMGSISMCGVKLDKSV